MTFRLNHEWAGDPRAPKTLLVLHGIMGNLRNWRSFARRFAEDVPDWRVLTVDLRNHGGSLGAPAPQDLPSAAGDLLDLGVPVDAIAGHSFGGKVAMEFARCAPPGLERVMILDCPLSAVPVEDRGTSEVARVIEAVAAIPMPVDRRSEVVDILRGKGFSRSLAGWMSTNLRKEDGAWTWSFDPGGIRELLEDYWARDEYDVLEEPPPGIRFDLVRAVESDRWSPAELERMVGLGGLRHVSRHLLADAGHWLHVDNPDGLLSLMERVLSP